MKIFVLACLLGMSGTLTAQQKMTTYSEWANFDKYGKANTELRGQGVKDRVVFMGNSITEGWSGADPDFFKGKPYVNRGISGQTTPQMLLRFRSDVIDLKPAVVVILAGINDIAQNTGPATTDQIAGNIFSMAELARANKIKVVLCSVLPAYDFPWRPGLQPADKVVQLNQQIRDYAKAHNIVYVDYFSAMADERKGLPAHLAGDGIHPTPEGYRLMEPLVEKGIATALRKK